MKERILRYISDEEVQADLATRASEKAERINNIIQLKIHSKVSELENDIYVDVKKFITFYISSLKEKQYNYDEFNEEHIVNLINHFDIERKCNLLEFILKELKNENFLEKTVNFEKLLDKQQFLKEWKKLRLKNVFRMVYTASVYNHWTIFFSLILCFLFCYFIYLPAPDGWPILFSIKYHMVSENFVLNHISNILMSIFDIQQDKFVMPLNMGGTLVLLGIKGFFLLIVVNVFIDQLKKRFKI